MNSLLRWLPITFNHLEKSEMRYILNIDYKTKYERHEFFSLEKLLKILVNIQNYINFQTNILEDWKWVIKTFEFDLITVKCTISPRLRTNEKPTL